MPRPAVGAAMIEVDGVSVTFGAGAGAFVALDKVSVNIGASEFFTLLGPSGCGKTTLLRAIAGFVRPSAGEIRLGGKDLLALAPNARPVNTVFQSYALFPHLTVAQNVGFGLAMQDRPKAEIARTVDEMLALVKMSAMAHRRPSELSGGQQQRVALARALAPRPKVLLLDESLSALDMKLRKEMQIELKRLQHETGITFIFVTHDQEEALTMSDRIAVMQSGRILQVGSPREIYDFPTTRFVADFIGETNFVAVRAEADAVVLPGGERIRPPRPDLTVPAGKAVLTIRPEHASIDAQTQGAPLTGQVQNIVYCGTDTHVHLTLADGARFVVRRQNRPDQVTDIPVGQTVGIRFDPNVARLLVD